MSASAVAPDEVLRPQRLAVGQLDGDAGVVPRETDLELAERADRASQVANSSRLGVAVRVANAIRTAGDLDGGSPADD